MEHPCTDLAESLGGSNALLVLRVVAQMADATTRTVAALATNSSTPELNYRPATRASQRQCGCQVALRHNQGGPFNWHTRPTEDTARDVIFEYIEN